MNSTWKGEGINRWEEGMESEGETLPSIKSNGNTGETMRLREQGEKLGTYRFAMHEMFVSIQ